MNVLFPRFLRLAYRKEPISSFILILGAVDAVIGGFGGRWSLLSVGLIIALTGILVRWRQLQKAQAIAVHNPAKYVLPPSPSNQPLPLLTKNKQRKSN
jgi:hypothetical protein